MTETIIKLYQLGDTRYTLTQDDLGIYNVDTTVNMRITNTETYYTIEEALERFNELTLPL